MNEITVYGSKLCPDTVEALEAFKKNCVGHIYLDITEDLANLRAFLKFRDLRSEYECVRQKGGIGIPLFVREGGEDISFDYREFVR